MELRNLRHFSALAETLNYRIAAERLYLTQSALTRSIAALERELGVRLFDRDKRHVSLTAEGTELLERAHEVLSDAGRLADAAGAIRARQRHEVRVAVYGVALAELTHPVIEAFCQRYPNVSIRVYDADFHRGLDPVLSGEYDVALARLNTDVPELTRVPIFTEPSSLPSGRGIRWPRRPRWTWPKSSTIPGSPPTRGPTSGCAGDRRDGAAPTVGYHARSAVEMCSTIAYQHMVGLMPLSGPRLFPHPGVDGVPPKEPLASVAAVAYPETGFSPAAPVFAEMARRVARRGKGVPHAEPVG